MTMRRDYFELLLTAAMLFCIGGLFVSCISLKDAQRLEDYRRFVDYMERTNEPFEVACETDYYTPLMQEDRK